MIECEVETEDKTEVRFKKIEVSTNIEANINIAVDTEVETED